MKKCLVGFMGVCLLIAIAGVAHAAGKVTISETDETVQLQDKEYRKLVLVKVENKNEFKGLTGFFLTRPPSSTGSLWDISLRFEDGQGTLLCANKTNTEYKTLLQDHFKGIPLLKDSDAWSLMSPYTIQGLTKDLGSQSIITDVNRKYSFSSGRTSTITTTAFIEKHLGRCDNTVVWEVIQRKFVDQDTTFNDKNQEKNSDQELKNKTTELESSMKKLLEEKDKKDNQIKLLKTESDEHQEHIKKLQSELDRIKLNMGSENKDLFLGMGKIVVIIVTMFFLLIFFLIVLSILIYRKCTIIVQEKMEMAKKIVESFKRFNEIFALNFQTTIDQSVERVISNISDSSLSLSSYSSFSLEKREKSLQDLKKALEKTFKERHKDINTSRESSNGQQQIVWSNSLITSHISSLLVYIENIYGIMLIYFGELQENQQKLTIMDDLKKRCKDIEKANGDIIQEKDDLRHRLDTSETREREIRGQLEKSDHAHTALQGEHRSLKENYDSIVQKNDNLLHDFKKSKDEIRELKKSRMVRNGFLDEGKVDDSEIDSFWYRYENSPRYVLEFSSHLTGLREFLQQSESNVFPDYYSVCDINGILKGLQGRSYERFFRGNRADHREFLKGEWRDYWWQIFRAALLIETYWPDSNSDLLDKLNYARNSILYVLKQYGMELHSLRLLDKDQVDERRITSNPLAPLDKNLTNHVRFQQKVMPLAAQAPTPCDVKVWGYDLDGSPAVKSQLIVIRTG